MLARIILVVVALCGPVFGQHEYHAQAWEKASEYLRQYMNTSAVPCQNFFDHVCGNYIKTTEDPYEMNLLTKSKMVSDTMMEMLEQTRLDDSDTPRYRKALKVFYDQCMTIQPSDDWTVKTYEAFKRRFGAISLFETTSDDENFKHWKFAGALQGMADAALFLRPTVSPRKDCQGTLRMQMGFFGVRFSRYGGFVFNATEAKDMLLHLGRGMGKSLVDLEPSVDVVIENITDFIGDYLKFNSMDDRTYELHELLNGSSAFNFSEYLDGFVQDDETRRHLLQVLTTITVEESVVSGLDALFKRHSPSTIKTMALVRILQLIKEFYFDDIAFWYGQGELHYTPKNNKERCLEFMVQYLTPAAAKAYFDHIEVDISTWRSEIQLMVRNIISAFRVLLNSVDWLDADDKEIIQKKIDRIRVNPGLPSWIANDEEIMKRVVEYDQSLSPYDNDLRARMILQNIKLRSSLDLSDNNEPNPTFTVNAFYHRLEESITICLGMMLPPMFNNSYPLPVKYGSLGWIIGHELIHAFDYAEMSGTVKELRPKGDWIKANAVERFRQNANCLIKQYSTYCYRDAGKCVQGQQTASENIADIAGLKVAYTAYKLVAQVIDDDPPVPGMIEYTNDQLFFIAAARNWCSTGTPTERFLNDPHSPSSARVEVTMRNVPMFSEAFGCVAGSKYIPSKRCNIWGQLFRPCEAVPFSRK